MRISFYPLNKPDTFINSINCKKGDLNDISKRPPYEILLSPHLLHKINGKKHTCCQWTAKSNIWNGL